MQAVGNEALSGLPHHCRMQGYCWCPLAQLTACSVGELEGVERAHASHEECAAPPLPHSCSWWPVAPASSEGRGWGPALASRPYTVARLQLSAVRVSSLMENLSIMLWPALGTGRPAARDGRQRLRGGRVGSTVGRAPSSQPHVFHLKLNMCFCSNGLALECRPCNFVWA